MPTTPRTVYTYMSRDDLVAACEKLSAMLFAECLMTRTLERRLRAPDLGATMSPRAPAPYQDWKAMSTISTMALYVQTFLSPDGKIELTVQTGDGIYGMHFAVHGKPGRVYREEADARAAL